MKVEMKIKIAGSRNGVRWPEAGTVLDLPEGEAVDLISQGVAVAVASAPKPEKAVAKKPEKRG